MMAAIGTDEPPPPAPAPARDDAPSARESRDPVKKFDLREQSNASRRAPEADRVPPPRTVGEPEAEDSDEDEALYGDGQHEGLAQFINRARDYEPALPAEVARYYMREAGASAADDIVGLVALATDHFLASVVNEAGEAAALRGEAPADGGRRVLRTADVMAALQQRGVDAMRGGDEASAQGPPPAAGGQKRARGA